MTRRKVTMLEAFQDSARTSQERRDAALSRNQQASGSPGVDSGTPASTVGHRAPTPALSVHDGPAIVPVDEASRGQKHKKAEAKRAAIKGAGAGAEGARLTLPFSASGFAALQILLLIGAFILGRQFEEHGFGRVPTAGAEAATGGRIEAASFGLPGRAATSRQALVSGAVTSPRDEPTTIAAGDGAAPQEGPAGGVTPTDPDTEFDRAFWDPSMRFTVLAINYSQSPANEALAWDTYDLLMGLGFPVVKPLSRRERIFLHVGAAASIDELSDLRDQLQNLRVGPRRTPDFRTAYVVNIERETD
ncbi:MAG: hypothetical protein ACPGPE_13305 [Planctomycetota bacterium]